MTIYANLTDDPDGEPNLLVEINGNQSTVPFDLGNRHFSEMLTAEYMDSDGTILQPNGGETD